MKTISALFLGSSLLLSSVRGNADPKPADNHVPGVLLTNPTARSLPQPVYPSGLKDKNVVGTALVEFVVTSKGNTDEIKVLQASDPAFGEAASAAVQKAKFYPGTDRDGKPINVRMQVPFTIKPGRTSAER